MSIIFKIIGFGGSAILVLAVVAVILNDDDDETASTTEVQTGEEQQSQVEQQSRQVEQQEESRVAASAQERGTQDSEKVTTQEGGGRAETLRIGVVSPDGTIGCPGGVRVNDESKATFRNGGVYRIHAHDDLKLEIPGRDTIQLPENEDVYVRITSPTQFEINNWGPAGYACIYASSTEERDEARAQQRRQEAAQRAAQQRREAAQRASRTDQEIAEDCLSPWDGNHDDFERQIRERLNDPGSMTTHATYFGRVSGEFTLRMDYGARNAFGGMVRTEAIAIMDTATCEVTVIDYGFE